MLARRVHKVLRMTQRHLTSAFLRSARVRALTQAGAALTMLALWGCGGTGTTNGDDAGAGGSATGGGGTGGDSSGGAASGGTATGGSGAGGAGAGGTASGGAQGETVPACPGFPAASESTGCRSQADCLGASCQATQPSGTICGACFASPMECGTDAACGEGAVCVTGPDMPCQCNGRGTVCAAACT